MTNETPTDSVDVQPSVGIPRFSLVLETENLASINPEILIDTLKSLAAQNIPPSQAQEVVLIDSGDMSDDLLSRVLADFPWVTVLTISPDIDYYAAFSDGRQPRGSCKKKVGCSYTFWTVCDLVY